MNVVKNTIGKYNYILYYLENNELISSDLIIQSWKRNIFQYPKNDTANNKIGFRSAQLGGLYAIKSYWTIKNKPATIVMPTGTGKTETMIATVISECRNKTCVIVPSDLLRKQTSERFCSLHKLREIKAIDDNFLSPIVGILKSNPKQKDDLYTLIDSCNIIVSTCSLLNKMSEKTLSEFASNFDTLIIDEAHHVPSKSWEKVKKQFIKCKCLQFTATPFREDGKKIKGEIIYNFPLKLAQEQHFFKEFEFYGVEEFDAEKKDFAVAKKAVEILKRDIEEFKYPHLLLVRVSKQQRARNLFNNIYNKYYSQYKPVLIISDNKNTNQIAMKSIHNGISKIIICVNMFSEGIDFPELKICAIHDKYKSLPITLQFVGRLARAQANLGKASIIANTVDDDTNEAMQELYSQDSDWNQILRIASDEKIAKELTLQKLAQGFKGNEIIPINNIVPKISMFIYRTSLNEWNLNNIDKLFKKSTFNLQQNFDEKILIITELNSNKVGWTTSKEINNSDWNLHLLYWNEEKQIFFIDTTEKSIANKLAELVFPDSTKIIGENIFRCLYGINRLMLSTVGLNSMIINNRIRYRMYAGIDIERGINEAIQGSSTKSNLFGVGYENGQEISIGCSYKGTVWAKWVETINYWKHWCDNQSVKILNDKIETKEILKNVLIPVEIDKRPNIIPYRIEFPITAENELKEIINLSDNSINYPFYKVDIKLSQYNQSGLIYFEVSVNNHMM